MDCPRKSPGFAIPNSAKMVGAMSVSAGFSMAILRLLNTTPGTSVESMQWSPLHGLVLSSITSGGNAPRIVCHPARYPRLYPTSKSGPLSYTHLRAHETPEHLV